MMESVLSAEANSSGSDVQSTLLSLQTTIQESRQAHALAKQWRLQTRKSLDAYAKASCRALCQHLFARLPREIRDMVYGYIIEPPRKIRFFEVVGPNSLPTRVNTPKIPHSLRLPGLTMSGYDFPSQLSHCFDVEFVGRESLKEIIEVWYRTASIDFDVRYDLIPAFLDTRSPEFSIRLGDLFTRIEVYVVEKDFLIANCETKGHLTDSIFDTADELTIGKACGRVKTLISSLQQIAITEHRVEVIITLIDFDLRSKLSDDRIEDYVKTLQPLFPTLCLLRDAEHIVKLQPDSEDGLYYRMLRGEEFPGRFLEWWKTQRDSRVSETDEYTESSTDDHDDHDDHDSDSGV